MAQPRSYSKRAIFEDLGYEPHAGQIPIHRSKAPRRIVACGVRFGKTKCAAMEGLAAALMPAKHSIGWIAAPTYDLCDRVFREIQVVVLEQLKHRLVQMRESDRKIVLRNLSGGLSEIKAKSADNPVSLLGEGLDWLIIDEAARLKPTIWQEHLSQRLIDKKGWALMISTPKGKGWLFDLYKRGQSGNDPDYESWNFPSWSNPLLEHEWIDAERARLPERVFREQYNAEFIEGSGAVFRNIRECATGKWQEPVPGKRYCGGLDLAKVEDFTVLTILNEAREVVFVDRFNRLDWSEQVARIQGSTERYNRAQVLVDSTGAGEPVYESLRKEGIDVTGYSFTAKSKAALLDNLIIMIEKRQLTLPRADVCPQMIDELEGYEYSISEYGTARASAPRGQHDDHVMSLALAAWKARKPRAEVHVSVISRRNDWWTRWYPG